MNNILKYDESNVKQRKRKEIIETSMDIFIRDGITKVTMIDIAKECGISLRSLYYYYKNKEELAVDIQMVCMNIFSIQEHYKIEDNDSGYEAVCKFLDGVYNNLIENQKVVKFITAFDYYFYNEYPNEKYISFLSSMQSKKVLEDDILSKINDGSVNLYGKEAITVLATVFQSLLAYAQKIIYREKAMLSENIEGRGDLKLYIEFFKTSLKNT